VQAAPASQSRQSVEESALRARHAELGGQLRAAVMEGDEARTRRLLSELLRGQGLSKAQRIPVQLKALLNLVRSLRCATVTDELTGLCNQRGFVQIGTRLLDVAARDGSAAHLVYFEVNDIARVTEALGPTAADVLLRQMANFMRDLYPSYGVHEVLGRLEGVEFAALTMNPEYASRGAIMLRVRRPPHPGSDLPPLSLSVGVAHFNPRRPVGIDELLANARQSLHEQKRASETASSGLTPQPVRRALNGLEAEDVM
jgi:diguanylate cyclase (GGDEF)-like protein